MVFILVFGVLKEFFEKLLVDWELNIDEENGLLLNVGFDVLFVWC